MIDNPPSTIHYLYDDWNRIAEFSGQTLAKTYLWGMDLSGSMQGAGGVGGLLAHSEHGFTEDEQPVATRTTYNPTYDGNGNITECLDATGEVAAHFKYDPFGNTTVASLLQTENLTLETFQYRLSTKPRDPATGLYYYGYRWYDPLTGRWPSRDPIGEDGGLNLYGFLGNGGVNKSDRLGLYCVQTSFKWIGEAKIDSYRINWDSVGSGTKVATSLTVNWQRHAEIGCCCDRGGSRRYTTYGMMIGTTTEQINDMGDEGTMITGGSPMPQFDIPSPKKAAEVVGEVFAELISKALPAPGSGISRDDHSGLITSISAAIERIEDSASGPGENDWVWFPKWPCD